MKNGPLIRQPYSAEELAELSTYVCSKTIFDTPEIELTPDLFCQPIDIGIDLEGDTTADIPNMDNYPMRSPVNAIAHIKELLSLGITSVMVRMDSPNGYTSKVELLKRQARIIKDIRTAYPLLNVIVDPFSVALNSDKTWGVINNGKLDYMLTIELFSAITTAFVDAGASYVLTLGRFEREVDVTKRTIKLVAGDTKVSSFSTNTETTNAYVYSDHGAYAITKQKILVSNYHEMVFRAIIDIYEGSELVVVKPAENLHILEKLKTIIQHAELLTEFLDSSYVKAIAKKSSYLKEVRQAILADRQKFMRQAQKTRLAAYTVSGTYFQDMQTFKRKGGYFLASLLYERYSNIAGVLHATKGNGLIIDRNAYWFFAHSDK